jgi:hypothetical protein
MKSTLPDGLPARGMAVRHDENLTQWNDYGSCKIHPIAIGMTAEKQNINT